MSKKISSSALTNLARFLELESKVSLLETELADQLKQAKCIEKGNSCLWYKSDDWDSELFKVPVFKIEHFFLEKEQDFSDLLETLLQKEKGYFLFRLPQTSLSVFQVIEHKGGILLDSSIELIHTSLKTHQEKKFTVSEFMPSDKEQLLECATAFKYGRFFTEPKFSVGQKAYASWVSNSIEKRAADRIFTITQKNTLMGFITVKAKEYLDKKVLYVPLIAKHPACLESGIGKALLNHVLLFAKQNDYSAVTIGTQTQNIPALVTYTKMGFIPYSSELTFRILTT